MPRKDVHLNSDGDIEIGYDGDIKYSLGDDVLVENVIFRLKTYIGDYTLEPYCGASLEDFIGEPNTREIGNALAEQITNALTHDNFLTVDDFSLRVVPINTVEIMIAIVLKGETGNYTITASLDLRTGYINVTT